MATVIARSAQLVQQMKAAGASKSQILVELAKLAESFIGPGATVSILLLDENGTLKNGASPNLPVHYLAAIEGIKADPQVGTCAAAAATGEVVITKSIYADQKWAKLKQLPLSLGYIAAFSVPIKASDGSVLGTFGTYFRHRNEPTAEELDGIRRLAAEAAKVIKP